jgi:hypothetical protein
LPEREAKVAVRVVKIRIDTQRRPVFSDRAVHITLLTERNT